MKRAGKENLLQTRERRQETEAPRAKKSLEGGERGAAGIDEGAEENCVY